MGRSGRGHVVFRPDHEARLAAAGWAVGIKHAAPARGVDQPVGLKALAGGPEHEGAISPDNADLLEARIGLAGDCKAAGLVVDDGEFLRQPDVPLSIANLDAHARFGVEDRFLGAEPLHQAQWQRAGRCLVGADRGTVDDQDVAPVQLAGCSEPGE